MAMLALLFSNPLAFVIAFSGLVIALTIHEFAHAWVADKLGDPTPRYQGRVTLDPRAHLDPLGTLALLLVRFGWGKPVQFDPYNLAHPIRDTALIALAGPLINLVFASFLGIAIQLNLIPFLWLNLALAQVVIINVYLAIFNLVPVHPLDGSKILMAILPPDTAQEYEEFMHRYGIFVLLLLIFPWGNGASPISRLISPVIEFVIHLLLG